MNKFDKVYSKLIRSCQRHEPMETIGNKNYTIGDVILESVLPSPFLLINDIIKNLKNNKNEFSYNKETLKQLSNKDWKYFNLIDKLPDDFSLTILNCQEYEIKEKFKNIKPQGMMMEFSPNNDFKEYIWIGQYFKEYDDSFKNLLKHELGHVWTFIFGLINDNFKDGQGPSNYRKKLNKETFNHFQLDVFIHLYNENLEILNFDYNYVLCKNDDSETANYELPVHIDNIIEILINDYLTNSTDSPQNYINNLFEILKNNKAYSFKDLSLLRHFKENKKFQGFSTIESIKNPIRRLFLIFTFGTNEQIEYFKKELIKEFGEIDTKNK